MIEQKDDQVIVAQATAQGAGAIAMIRVSGVKAIEFVDAIAHLAGQKKLTNQLTHTIHYGWIVDNFEQHIDQVLFLLMHGPKTFTGQNVVEITCHNNQLLIEKILDRLISVGARLADCGEFTKRSVLAGKIDLVQAEAINELIHAQTEKALDISLRQLEGSFSSWIKTVEDQLIRIIGLCEASFEFLDEEISFGSEIIQRLDTILEQIRQLLKNFTKQEYIRQGVRVALVGSVNAGKSSLFNQLIAKNRAIVSNIPGTTRDTIEASLHTHGIAVTFVDTAGLRTTDDTIEKIGIDRSFQEVASCDIILLVFDATSDFHSFDTTQYQSIIDQYQDKVILVQNKIDQGSGLLPNIQAHQCIPVSTITESNIDQLRQKIDEKINNLMQHGQTPCLLNKRHYSLLLALEQELLSIKDRISIKIDYELLVISINDALTKLSQVTGKTVTEDVLDAIFRDFCVGK